ncbi:hypothetical protein HME9304_02061 [Flagellimonas maritima]|uniref:Uncharacterized protein n=1 Tax=Flagellimonas maritima TaxID=1383885 RepID=A0A2Z4LTF3_9FLAO|nr:hypothetical protein [Allomuricauda aurantiaca]AWX45053.1 hypothetical protein HME9304_02061 [Allomuricauda aurantiaca]
MKRSFENSLEVLELAEKELLYEKLVLQIKKDFDRANTKLNFPSNILPSDLVKILHEKIYFLLLEKFQECLNLLYMVDVSERDIKKIKSSDAVDVSAEVCFLLLKREWQKVWFKYKFGS